MLSNVFCICRRMTITAASTLHRACTQTTRSQLIPPVGQSIQTDFHTDARRFGVMDKDIRNRGLIKLAADEKLEQLETHHVDVTGLTDAGMLIPTLETHASLIDGVRYDELPIVHIHSSPNNTIMTLTDHTGRQKIAVNSCGREGFKNVKKSTNVAAQATGLTIGTEGLKKGVRSVRVVIKGLGAGRLASVKGLQMAGLQIISISDRTHVPHGAPRARKAKRL